MFVLLFQFCQPGFKAINSCIFTQYFACGNCCAFGTGFQFFDGVAEIAAAAGSKQYDFFTVKIIAFQKSIDNGWCNMPPDRET